jgi:adenylate cyclase
MAEAAARRRLAAILAADVVGYSRLMETAEAATLARLKAHRAELIDPLLVEHGGRLIKLMGDGALVEFPSVVEAVACALAIQQGMVEREADRPEPERIRFRIGINLGNVIVEGDDIYGDGVNIASRLEGLADPDGIALSAAAFDQVVGKLPVSARDLGERTLKNIARPVRVYALGGAAAPARPASPWRWRVAAATTLAVAALVGGWLLWIAPGPDGVVTHAEPKPVAERPAVAVLPFTSLGDPGDAYLGDELTEDVAGALSRFGELAVIDPAASLAGQDRSAAIATIGRELGARYVVRGTVRRDGPQLRVTAQLVEAPTGSLRWSQHYEVAQADIFAVQDDITRRIAGAMAVQVDQLEQVRVAAQPPGSLEVYELTLRGRRLASEGTRAGNREARRILAEAVGKDPDYAPARVALGEALYDYALGGWTESPQEVLGEAEDAAHAALAIDPDLASGSGLLGAIYLVRRQFDLALAEFDRALLHARPLPGRGRGPHPWLADLPRPICPCHELGHPRRRLRPAWRSGGRVADEGRAGQDRTLLRWRLYRRAVSRRYRPRPAARRVRQGGHPPLSSFTGDAAWAS